MLCWVSANKHKENLTQTTNLTPREREWLNPPAYFAGEQLGPGDNKWWTASLLKRKDSPNRKSRGVSHWWSVGHNFIGSLRSFLIVLRVSCSSRWTLMHVIYNMCQSLSKGHLKTKATQPVILIKYWLPGKRKTLLKPSINNVMQWIFLIV